MQIKELSKDEMKDGEVYDCYDCLSTNIPFREITDFTGGKKQWAICPYCCNDSIVNHVQFRYLYAYHVQGIHFGCMATEVDFSKPEENTPTYPMSCSNSFDGCRRWNKIVLDMLKKETEDRHGCGETK